MSEPITFESIEYIKYLKGLPTNHPRFEWLSLNKWFFCGAGS